MKYNKVLSNKPAKWLWRIWNPFRVPDGTGSVIADIRLRMRSNKTSKRERARRKKEGKGERLCFSVTGVRELGCSSDSD